MSKTSNRTVTVVGVGIVLLALSVVLLSVLSPVLSARKALRTYSRALREAEAFSYVSVIDPREHSDIYWATDAEARLTDKGEIDALRDLLLTYMDGAKYSGVKESVSGNWDIRVRFAGEELIDIYLREDCFYFSQNGRKFLFEPTDAAAYTAWRTAWLDGIFAQG